ncbi:Hint domain-containing protein [Sulfitobacter sp.]|uniref:Hint domain-containing protein n=1 Tax=Sulfitobacter sp. TaxID=1903071 RepID=UPI003001F531
MSFQIFGIDTEFAASTGSNVNTSPGRSRFDNPPQGSKDFAITTKDGDPEPRRFDIGDTYDLSWGGQAGSGTITDAVVVRSDLAPSDGGGIIVFEGLDENGNTAQIIWTPGFDLEQWYADSYNRSAEPEFYATDLQSDYTHGYVCFAAETRIRTPEGYREAGRLVSGDLVRTVDEGDVPLLWTARWQGVGHESAAPVCFSPGSLGNRREIRLSQQHRVLTKSVRLQMLYGLEEALVPARAFVNGANVRLSPAENITYVHLMLAQHHILDAEGTYCESLYLGDQSSLRLFQNRECAALVAATDLRAKNAPAARPFLSMKEAQLLLHGGCAAQTMFAAAQPPMY